MAVPRGVSTGLVIGGAVMVAGGAIWLFRALGTEEADRISSGIGAGAAVVGLLLGVAGLVNARTQAALPPTVHAGRDIKAPVNIGDRNTYNTTVQISVAPPFLALILLVIIGSLRDVATWAIALSVLVGTGGALVASTRWGKSRWQAGLGIVVLCGCLTGSLLAPAVRTSDEAAPPGQPEYLAYTTSAGAFLAKPEDTTTTRIWNPHQDESIQGLSWSSDGRYLAGTVHRQDKSTRIWAYDVEEGHSVEWPECDCLHAGFVGGQLLAVRGRELAVLTMNFGTPQFLLPQGVDLTTANILGTSADGMIVAISDPAGVSAYGGPEELFTIKADGAARRVYGTGSNKRIAMPTTRGDADYLGWKTGWRNGFCQDFEYVRAFRTANASTYEIDSPDREAAWTVVSLRWARDQGRSGSSPWILYSVQIPSKLIGDTCAEGAAQLFRAIPGNQWEQVPAPPDVVDSAVSASGVLAVRTGRYRDPEAHLMFIENGVRQSVSNGVREMLWSR